MTQRYKERPPHISSPTKLPPPPPPTPPLRVQVEVIESQDGHSGDCTYYALPDCDPLNGICICGYGLRMARKGNFEHLFSKHHPSYTPTETRDEN